MKIKKEVVEAIASSSPVEHRPSRESVLDWLQDQTPEEIGEILKNLSLEPRYYIIYKNNDDKVKTYQIGKIDLYSSFGNKEDDRGNVGFKAYCYGRKAVRSFRHDRIISITRK